jgi:hypothetical protein
MRPSSSSSALASVCSSVHRVLRSSRVFRPRLGEHGLQFRIAQPGQFVTRPLEIPPVDLPGCARKSRRHMDDQHAPIRCLLLLHWNAMQQPVVQTRLGAPRLGECRRADDSARALVGHAEDDLAAAFVGQGDAVLDQFLEVIVLLRLLEFETDAFGLGEPVLEVVGGGRHDALQPPR